MTTKQQRYLEVWREWAMKDPAAIENDAPEYWAAVRAAVGEDIEKHHGPGPHPGTGTSQDVHGKGGGGKKHWADEMIDEMIPDSPTLSQEEASEQYEKAKGELTDLRSNASRIENELAAAISDKVKFEDFLRGFDHQLEIERGLDKLPPQSMIDKEKARITERLELAKAEEERLRKQLSDDRSRIGVLTEETKRLLPLALGYDESTVFPSDRVPLRPATEINIPETLPEWTAPAPNYELLSEVDDYMFRGADNYSQEWNVRTREGKEAVAALMEEHFGEQIRQEVADFKAEYKEVIYAFADEQWEKYTGVESTRGFDSGGNETWRAGMGQRWVEGQGVLEVQYHVNDTDNSDPLLLPSAYLGRDETYDPDDAFSVAEYLTDFRFVDAIQESGVEIRSRGRTDNTIMERGDAARSRVRELIEHDLSAVEEQEGLVFSRTKGNSSLVSTVMNWETYGEGLENAIVQDLRTRWANSSSDPFSIATQYAIDDVFPTNPDTSHFDPDAAAEGAFIYERFPETFRAYASSVYSHTQAGFEAAGITHVPIVRGMGATEGDDFVLGSGESGISLGDWERGFDLFNELPDPHSIDGGVSGKEFDSFSIEKNWDTGTHIILDKNGGHQLTLNAHKDGYKIAWTSAFDYGYEGGEVLTSSEDLISYIRTNHFDLVSAGWMPARVDMQPISASGTATTTSRTFAPTYDNYNRGITHALLLRATVPREWIWAHSTDGFGSLKEHEVLVLGAEGLPFDVVSVPLGESLPSELIFKAVGWTA